MPLDGEAFFTSAITPAWPAAILPRRLASKPRRLPRASRSVSTSLRRLCRLRYFLAAATSSAFTARILLSMSDMVCLLVLLAVRAPLSGAADLSCRADELLQLRPRRAGRHGLDGGFH